MYYVGYRLLNDKFYIYLFVYTELFNYYPQLFLEIYLIIQISKRMRTFCLNIAAFNKGFKPENFLTK